MQISKDYSHKPIRDKYNPKPNADELVYREEIRKLGCLVCKRYAAIHHVPQKKGPRRSHYRIVPLCWDHHQGPEGYHKLASNDKFLERYGINLYEKAIELNEQYSA